MKLCDDLLARIEAMGETLDAEWGAEYSYYRDQFNEELAEHALDIALALLSTQRRMREHVEKWRRWRLVRLEKGSQ